MHPHPRPLYMLAVPDPVPKYPQPLLDTQGLEDCLARCRALLLTQRSLLLFEKIFDDGGVLPQSDND